jgi:hypothetical protein
MRELNFLRKRYKQQILLETKKIMSRSNLGSNSQSTSNSTSTCSPIEFDPVSQRISTRKKKFINFENSLPDPVIHLMMSDQYSDPNDQTIFPDAFETFNNCKKKSNVDRYYNRTAGLFCAIRPCGIICFFSEMFKSESPTHAALTIGFEFMKNEQTKQHIPTVLVYDRACDLHPTVNSLQKDQLLPVEVFGGKKIMVQTDAQGNSTYIEKIYPSPLYMVDRFHVHGHTEKKCVYDATDPDSAIYHYKNESFKILMDGVNTSVCEQTFSWFSKYKNIMKRMNRYEYWFYAYILIFMHNTQIEKNYIKQKQNDQTKQNIQKQRQINKQQQQIKKKQKIQNQTKQIDESDQQQTMQIQTKTNM